MLEKNQPLPPGTTHPAATGRTGWEEAPDLDAFVRMAHLPMYLLAKIPQGYSAPVYRIEQAVRRVTHTRPVRLSWCT